MHPVILLLLSLVTTDWVWLFVFTRFLDHTQRRTTVGRTPLNEWSVRHRDLYLTTHNNHNRQISMPPEVLRILITLKNPMVSAGFEPANLGTKGQHATSRPPKLLGKDWYERGCRLDKLTNVKNNVKAMVGTKSAEIRTMCFPNVQEMPLMIRPRIFNLAFRYPKI